MEFDPQDQDIVELLTKLKHANGGYPAEMLAARRQNYLKQMAELGLGAGTATGLKEVAKHTGTHTVPSATSTLLEAALVVAIVAEASTVAYFYRDKIADFFKGDPIAARVEEITSVPPTAPELAGLTLTPSPAATATVPSTLTIPPVTASSSAIPVTVSSTPIPGVAEENNPGGPAVNQSNSTPVPNGNTNDNPGNHYGQTPKPERTKDSGNNDTGNTDPGSKDNSDTPPQSNNDTPKDNSKPPKNK